MGSLTSNMKVQVSEKAIAYIKSRKLANPMVLVNIGFRLSGGDGCGCGGNNSGKTVEYLSAILLDGGKPGGYFKKLNTTAGIPVYLSSRVYEAAQKSHSTLTVTVKGLVSKKLSIEGFDMAALCDPGILEKPGWNQT